MHCDILDDRHDGAEPGFGEPRIETHPERQIDRQLRDIKSMLGQSADFIADDALNIATADERLAHSLGVPTGNPRPSSINASRAQWACEPQPPRRSDDRAGHGCPRKTHAVDRAPWPRPRIDQHGARMTAADLADAAVVGRSQPGLPHRRVQPE